MEVMNDMIDESIHLLSCICIRRRAVEVDLKSYLSARCPEQDPEDVYD